MWKKEEVSHCCYVLGFPCGAVVQNPSTNEETQETWVRSLGLEDPLEEEMATHSSTLAWKILWTEEPCALQGCKQTKLSDWAHTWVSYFTR